MVDDKPIKVAFYIRVSTDDQVRGFGIDMQKNGLKDMLEYKGRHNNWIHRKEWTYIDEAKSGGDLNRPSFKNMMDDVKDGKIDLVAVYKIDRLSRNLSHLLTTFEKLQGYNVGFYSLKENIDFSGPIGRLTFQIFGALAEFERETIKMRTTEGKIASARMGNYIGNGIPYGYSKIANVQAGKGSKLKAVLKEVKWVERIFEWFVYERLNYEEITRRLDKLKVVKGVAAKTHHKFTKWNSSTVRGMILNSAYIGNRIEKINTEDGEVEINVPVPALIPEVLFRQAQLIAEKISKTKGKKGGGSNIYLLSRKIIDIDTETRRKFVGVPRTKGGFSYRRKGFTDSKGVKYKNKEIPAEALDSFVWEYMKMAINKPEEFFKLYQKQTYQTREIERFEDQQRQLDLLIKEVKQKSTSLFDEYLSGNISEEKKDELEDKYNKQIEGAEKEILELEIKINTFIDSQTALDSLDRFSEDFKKGLDNMTLEQKQRLVDVLVDRVEVSEIEGEINVEVHFRFAHNKKVEIIDGDEPKNVDRKTKKDPSGSSDINIGHLKWKGYIYIPIQGRVEKYLYCDNKWRRRVVLSEKYQSDNIKTLI